MEIGYLTKNVQGRYGFKTGEHFTTGDTIVVEHGHPGDYY